MGMLEKLRKHLRETSIEELKKEWEEVKEFEDVGPNALEFLEFMEKNDPAEKKEDPRYTGEYWKNLPLTLDKVGQSFTMPYKKIKKENTKPEEPENI